MRRGIVSMMLLVAAGCGSGENASRQPPSPTLTIPRPSGSPTGPPVPARPGALCGHVTTLTKAPARVTVVRGRTTCAEAMRVFGVYFDPATPAEGAAGLVVIGRWSCETRRTVTACVSRSATIRART